MERRWSRDYVKDEKREDTSHLREKRLDSLHSSLYLGHKPSESQQENVKPVREPIQRFTIGYHPKPAEFNKLYAQLMAPSGYGVYSGLTPLHVSASDHKALGLEVKNLYDFHINRQMHVVRRSPVGR